MKKNVYFYTNILAWGLVFLLIGNYVFGWTTPTANPPEGDLYPPLDISLTEQTKAGNLIIDGLLKVGRYSSAPTGSTGAIYYDTTENEFKGYKASSWDSLGGGATPAGSTGYIQFNNAGALGADSNFFWDNTNKRVGIGTTAPGYKLDVASGGSTTARFGTASTDYVTIGDGAGKLNVGTIDPIYTINGKHYATYFSGMIGVKEETTGIIEIQKSKCKNQNYNSKIKICEYVINFNDLEENSDLWLFAKITNLKENFDKMVVLLTPAFDGKIWYDKDINENRLTIFAIPNFIPDSKFQILNSNLEISYRLTAPRFDYNQWSNYSDIDAKGFNLDRLLE